jgi:DNA-binding response OmpR family regulator
MLGFILRSHGFAVREANDGAPALVELETTPPDVMLLDLMMPVDGYSVLEAMRSRALAPDTRVVVLTCMGSERDLVRGWELGADEYLVKPVDPEYLVTKLNDVLNGAVARTRPPG